MTRRYLLATLLALLAATPAAAQVDPTSAEVMVFQPGQDPVIGIPLAIRGTAISKTGVACNRPDVTQSAPGPNPTRVIFDDPFTAGRFCEAPLPDVPVGTGYRASAMFSAPGCQDQSPCFSSRTAAAGTFAIQAKTCEDGVVVLLVGDWTRIAGRATVGRVLFSLTQSTTPVVAVITRMDGVEVDRLSGNDLRKAAGAYVQLPIKAGTYLVTVEALNAAGCADGASRPMSILVQ